MKTDCNKTINNKSSNNSVTNFKVILSDIEIFICEKNK